MGYYIDPPNKTKEEWLEEHGQPVVDPQWPPREEQVYVCLIENPMFTAAGICYSKREFEEFKAPDVTSEQIDTMRHHAEAVGVAFLSLDTGQQRPRTWYAVPKDRILAVCPMVEEVLCAS